ncbi:MAG: TraR/DksA C4-type zinc finger protein [Geobacteraceae bacterium]|jgi:DnaK suppressor protein
MATGKMNKRQTRLREMLLEKKRAMWNELRDALFQNTGEELHSQFEFPLDPAEQGLIDLLADTGLTVADIRRQELTAMDEAMGRVERGTYGICDACGRVIPEERLRVMPFARYCREDQEKEEGPVYPPGAKF